MFGANVIYLVVFVLMSICVVLAPFVYVLRYRYYLRQFDMTAYQKRFQIGWPLMTVGAELTSIGGAMCMAWLQQWPPFSQDQWLILTIGICSSGFLCVFAAQVILAEGFEFLRARSRHTPANH